jgi:putative acetyltransferase
VVKRRGAAPIRPFRPDDAEALASLTLAAIRETGMRAYSPEQVAAWSARHPDPRRFRDSAAKGDTILLATDAADTAIAYVLMEADGHVDMLYCAPDHGGRGLAAELLARIEREARRRGIARLTAEASEVARPVFARAGFAQLHRRDFTIEHEGERVPIHNYAMDKRLSDA